MGYPRGSLEQRFWRHTRQVDNACWLWLGSVDGFGYGMLARPIGCNGSKMLRAHRVSYELFKGPIPVGKLVLHTCDNPTCVAPSHLFLGTIQDNMDDRERKGRGVRPIGSKHGNAKLTEESVTEMRRLYSCGVPKCDIAFEFGVSSATAGRVVERKSWTHV